MIETYPALMECARRRISQEWQCSDAERSLLSLIAELSYGLGQSWCIVPCLADFAAACSIHKSTACRALRAAVKKGYLEILQRQGETLYSIITTVTGTPRADAATRSAARERLMVMNKTRLQGQADASGQSRLPGVFESEEIEAPAAAFAALVEAPEPSETPDPLEKLLRTMEAKRGEVQTSAPPAAPSAPPPVRPENVSPPSQASYRPGDLWQRITAGLGSQEMHCLEMIRAECQTRQGGEAEFFKFAWVWRKRVQTQTQLYMEAAGVHKSLRLEQGIIARSPGAFIYRSVESATAANAQDVPTASTAATQSQ